MPAPRFAPFVHLTIERKGDLVCATLSQDSALPDQRLHIEYANMEGLALRKVAHAAAAARITDKWAPTADEILERMTEADRARFAPHLRQSAQDIAETMTATVGRIDAIMAPPAADNSLAGRLARHMASQYINPEKEALQDVRFSLSHLDETMTQEQCISLLRDLCRIVGVS